MSHSPDLPPAAEVSVTTKRRASSSRLTSLLSDSPSRGSQDSHPCLWIPFKRRDEPLPLSTNDKPLFFPKPMLTFKIRSIGFGLAQKGENNTCTRINSPMVFKKCRRINSELFKTMFSLTSLSCKSWNSSIGCLVTTPTKATSGQSHQICLNKN